MRAVADISALLAEHNRLELQGAPESFGAWMRINCRIDPRDEIFRFFARHPSSRNPVRDYLADGWRTLAELMVVLERLERPLLGTGHVLEFAAGFGRFTRHLAPLLPGRISVSDVQPGSVEFVRSEFGVEGFYSDPDPARIAFPRQYDLVFVLSLFTHLRPAAWPAWLAALRRAVAPGGLLLFTVCSEAAARESGVAFERDGTRYLASSESSALEAEVYGTTYTTRRFVEQSVAGAWGAPPSACFDTAFWAGQDAIACKA